MKALQRLIVKLADLIEAEGRAFRSGAVHVGLAMALAMGGIAMGVAGLSLIIWALYVVLSRAVGDAGAASICGLALLGCGAGLLALVRRMSR